MSFVTSLVGVPVRLHPETEQCVILKVTKIFVKADLSKEIPKSVNFTFQGKETLVEYISPWLPAKCTICGKWGHYARECRGKNIAEETHGSEVEAGEKLVYLEGMKNKEDTTKDGLNEKVIVAEEVVGKIVDTEQRGNLVENKEGMLNNRVIES